jgi:hypothetical protein
MQAHLSDASRPVRLMLDSGANGAVLFNTAEYLGSPHRRYLQGTGVDGRQRIFLVLPPQDVKIGSIKLSRVPFVSLPGTQKDSRAKGFDGVLTLGSSGACLLPTSITSPSLSRNNGKDSWFGLGWSMTRR